MQSKTLSMASALATTVARLQQQKCSTTFMELMCLQARDYQHAGLLELTKRRAVAIDLALDPHIANVISILSGSFGHMQMFLAAAKIAARDTKITQDNAHLYVPYINTFTYGELWEVQKCDGKNTIDYVPELLDHPLIKQLVVKPKPLHGEKFT